MDYMIGYSLKDIIEFAGCVNESILQKIAYQLLTCLNEYNELFNEDFGKFCICDIFFDKQGNLKVIFLILLF
jgi:hypothetical protein